MPPTAWIQARTVHGAHRRRWVLLTALAGMFATTFPITVLAVSLRSIADDLDAAESTVTWVITAPVLLGAVALPIVGKLGDLHGHRRVYLRGFSVATALLAATAAAPDIGWLIALRTLGQVSGAATLPASMALIMGEFPERERVQALGWWSLVAAGAPALGLAVGGPMVDLVGWRVIFVGQSGIALVAVLAAVVVLPETVRRSDVSFDLLGAATLSVGSGGLLFALNQGDAWGWSEPRVVAAALLAPVGFALFFRAEHRAREPLLPPWLVRRRNFAAGVATAFFLQAAYMGGFIVTPLLLDDLFGYSVATISLVMLVRPTVYAALSPVGGRLATRLGEDRMVRTGGLSMVAAMVLFVLAAGARNLVVVLAALVLQGAANGLARPSITASAANAAGEEHFGVAGATQRMVGQLGTATGITVLVLLAADGASGASAFQEAYGAGAVLAVLGTAAGWAIVPAADRSARHRAGGSESPRGESNP